MNNDCYTCKAKQGEHHKDWCYHTGYIEKQCPYCYNRESELHEDWCRAQLPFTQSMWDMYFSAFKEGDEVVVVTERDHMYWGKLETRGDEGCTLHRPGAKPLELRWGEVVFMSHDGFPIKKLRGMDGRIVIEKLDTSDTTAAIRTALTTEICPYCRELVPPAELKKPNQTGWEVRSERMSWVPRGTDTTDGKFDYRLTSKDKACAHCRQHKLTKIQTYFGDPWETGAAAVRIVNPGNAGPDWWGENFEEAIELTAKDGAIAHVYDLPIIFHVGAA